VGFLHGNRRVQFISKTKISHVSLNARFSVTGRDTSIPDTLERSLEAEAGSSLAQSCKDDHANHVGVREHADSGTVLRSPQKSKWRA
jgi:hypothetical protein